MEDTLNETDADTDNTRLECEADAHAILPIDLQFESLEGTFGECTNISWSPNGEIIAIMGRDNILRCLRTSTLQVSSVNHCPINVSRIKWSPSSTFMLLLSSDAKNLAISQPNSSVPAWAMPPEEPGLAWAGWSSCSRYVVSVAEMGTYSTLWEVSTDNSLEPVMDFPGIRDDVLPENMVQFSAGGEYIAICARAPGNDAICIYQLFNQTETEQISQKTPVADQISQFTVQCRRPAAIMWSPGDEGLFVRDDELRFGVEYYGIDGTLKYFCMPECKPSLGIRTWNLHSPVMKGSEPTASLLLLGGYDQALYILDVESGSLLQLVKRAERIDSVEHHVYVEVEDSSHGEGLEKKLCSNGCVNLARYFQKHSDNQNHKRRMRSSQTTTSMRRTGCVGLSATGAPIEFNKIGNTQGSSSQSVSTHFAAPTSAIILPSANEVDKAGIVKISSYSDESTGTTFIAAVDESARNVLCIYTYGNGQKRSLHSVMVFLRNITSFDWQFRASPPRLFIATGGSKIYVWQPQGAYDIPTSTEDPKDSLGNLIRIYFNSNMTETMLLQSKNAWQVARTDA